MLNRAAGPIGWIKGDNNTFRFALIQQGACARLGVEPEFPAMNQAGVTSSTFYHDIGSRVMVPESVQKSDSGWLFRRVGDDNTEARLQSLYEIACSQTHISPFLALPPGSEVTRRQGAKGLVGKPHVHAPAAREGEPPRGEQALGRNWLPTHIAPQKNASASTPMPARTVRRTSA